MSETKMWRYLAATLVACVTLTGVGCAQDVGDIDRSQPNKIKKSDFDQSQEWYYRMMIADSDVQGSLIFQGLMSETKRVRFVITEDVLFACSTTPVVEGELTDTEFFDGEECYGVVAAFPIMGHFDVQRSYSTATGEQSNVIVENYSDRPWYDREYMRVNWAYNLVDGRGMYGSLLGRFSAVAWTPDQDPGFIDENRTRLKPDEGYLEATTIYHYEPDPYACYDLSGNIWNMNCEAGQLTIRNSFVKVPEEKTFEPFIHVDNQLLLDDDTDAIQTTRLFDPSSGFLTEVECSEDVMKEMQENFGDVTALNNCQPLTFDYFTRFGYFRTDNIKFDTNYGGNDEGRLFYANHWHIWQTDYDENGEVLDYSQRKPKPITYYLNPEYPRDMIPSAEEVGRQWDIAFKNAVMVAKGYSSISEVEEELGELYDGDTRMFRIEHNGCMPNKIAEWYVGGGMEAQDADKKEVKALIDEYAARSEVGGADLENQLWGLPRVGLKRLCAELEFATEDRKENRFEWQREGDLRYSFYSWVEENNSGWAGYGPSSADPQTGEIISAGAHAAGTYFRTSSNYAADLVRFMNGDISEEDIYYGNQVREYLKDVDESSDRTMSQSLTPQGKREITRRATEGLEEVHTIDDVSPTRFNARPDITQLPDIFRRIGPEGVEQQANMMSRAASVAKRSDTRFTDFLRRPEVKSIMLADPQMLEVVEAMAEQRAGGRELTDEDLEIAFLELNNPELVMWRDRRRLMFNAERNVLSAADFSRAMDILVTYQGVADAFKGKSRAEIQEYFINKMAVGTQLHEVGHTVGLRHNFNASMDALNYHDEWWLLQKAVLEGELTQEQITRVPAERALELLDGVIDEAEVDQIKYVNETEFRLASVMDYTGDLTGRFAGLGKYDQAAINFVYGGHVQMWDDAVQAKLPNGLATEFFLAGYQDLPEILSGVPATEDETQRRLAGIDTILNGRKWVSIKEARQARVDGIKSNTNNYLRQQFTESNQPYQDMAIPYNFCSDDRADFQLGCDVFDWGSSFREIVNHNFNIYRKLQPFYRYKRQRLHLYGETINGFYGFVLRTMSSSARAFRFFSIYRLWDLGSYTDDLREAAIDAANFYVEVLATPEPGVYCKYNQDFDDFRGGLSWYYDVKNTYLPARQDFGAGECDDQIIIQPGVGQYYNYDITDEYDFRVRYIGTFIDKLAASQALFFVSANFLYNSFLTDTRATNVSYWTLFRSQMLDIIRGIYLNDYSKFGGIYTAKNGEQGNYVVPKMVDRNAFTHGTPDPQEGQPRIFNFLSFNHEFNMLAYALIANSGWVDRHTDFAQYVRIGVGDREVMDFGDAEIVEFINPITNQRYVAPQVADGESLSVDIIDWANRLKDQWLDSERDTEQKKAYYDAVREEYDTNFNPADCEEESLTSADDDLASVCTAMLDFEAARGRSTIRSEQLQDVVAKLDLLRWLRGVLGPDALN